MSLGWTSFFQYFPHFKGGWRPDKKLIRYIIAVIPAHVKGQHIWARPGPGPDSNCFSGTWQCGAWGWERSLMRPTFFQYFCACWTAAILLSCKQISGGKKNAPGLRKSKTVIYATKIEGNELSSVQTNKRNDCSSNYVFWNSCLFVSNSVSLPQGNNIDNWYNADNTKPGQRSSFQKGEPL